MEDKQTFPVQGKMGMKATPSSYVMKAKRFLSCKKNPALHDTVRDWNLVPEVRLELTRFYPADFESAASTIPPPGETYL